MALLSREINDVDFMIVDLEQAMDILRLSEDRLPSAYVLYNKTFYARYYKLRARVYVTRNRRRRLDLMVRMTELSDAYRTVLACKYTYDRVPVMRPERVGIYHDEQMHCLLARERMIVS